MARHRFRNRCLGRPDCRIMEPSDILYRPAEPSDAGYLLALEEACMRRHAKALWGRWQPSATIESYDTAGHRILMVSGHFAGCIAAIRRMDELFVSKLYIAPEYQNQGIGAVVLRTVTSQATKMNLPIRLTVLSTNPALRFYERQGFFVEKETAERRHLCFAPTGA